MNNHQEPCRLCGGTGRLPSYIKRGAKDGSVTLKDIVWRPCPKCKERYSDS